jgi:putative phosphoribosyl transferase
MFQDRVTAGHALAKALLHYSKATAIVIGLARGGVSVASAVASDLSLPLDVLVVKKIPSPQNPEYALGAVAPDRVAVVSWRDVERNGIERAYIEDQTEELSRCIVQSAFLYRKKKQPLKVIGKTVILVDDGLATGKTMEAAIKWCKAKKAQKIIVTVPVASSSAVARVTPEVDQCIVIETPPGFQAVGQYYREFNQITDENVIELL